MSTVDPMDIPTSVTKLSETAPNVSMCDPKRAAWALAHFWPAIREHFAQAVLNDGPADRDDFTVDRAIDLIRNS